MFEKGVYIFSAHKEIEKEKEENIMRRKILFQRCRKMEKEKEENIWRRIFFLWTRR